MEAFLALLLLPIVARSGNGAVALRTTLAALLLIGLVVAAAIARRHPRAATVLGAVLQVALIACGALIWPMYVLGVMFAALWLVAVRFSRQG
jgi:hypothetical protein